MIKACALEVWTAPSFTMHTDTNTRLPFLPLHFLSLDLSLCAHNSELGLKASSKGKGITSWIRKQRCDSKSPEILGDREGLRRHPDRLSLWGQVLSALPYKGCQVWVQTGLEGVVVRRGKSSVGKL